MLLPWTTFPETGTYIPSKSGDWLTFVLFVLPIVACLIKDSSKSLNKWEFYGAVTPSALAVLVGIFIIYFATDVNDLFFDGGVTIEYGLYFMILAGISLIIVTFKTKDKQKSEK